MGSGMSDEARVPDYSFIIVSWNAKAYLRQCLDSIKTESKGLEVEVIVVDNASSDGSPEMVQAEYPWVVLIRNDSNVGFARANNQGIAISSAKYLCLRQFRRRHPSWLSCRNEGLPGRQPSDWAGGTEGAKQRRHTPVKLSGYAHPAIGAVSGAGIGHALFAVLYVRCTFHDQLGA